MTIQRSAKVDCADITADTAKETPSGGIAGTGVDWACSSTDQVIGIELSQYQKADCSGDAFKMTIASGQCTLEGGDVKTADEQKITCDATDTIVWYRYERGDVTTSPKCEKEISPYGRYFFFKNNDGKCFTVHGTSAAATPAATKATPSPEGKAKSDASTNALATSFAVAGLIVSLVLM